MPDNRKSVAKIFSYTPLVILGCISVINPLTAAEVLSPQLISETEFFTDIPSVDSVTRLPQPKSETPAAVTIIDSEMIRASGARYLQDVFRLVPGFQVAYFNQERPIVTYHGLGDANARRMLILIDGRSVYGSFSGNINWYNTSVALDDIERIEVIRGPNTVTYGDNAVLGTINIITRHTAQTQGHTVKLTSGNHDIGDVLARYGTHFNGGDIRVTAGYSSEDGFDNRPDDLETKFINLRADLQPSTRDTLLLQLGLGRTDVGAGDFGSILMPPSLRERISHFEQIRWQHRFSEDNEFNVQFYHNYDETELDFLSEPVNVGGLGTIQIPISRDATQERYDLEFQHAFRLLPDLRLVWGLGAREDRTQSEPFFNANETFRNRSSRLFGNAEWHATSDTIINAGVLWEDNDLTGTDFSPRLAVNYHLSNKHTLRTAWSQAQRIPAIAEEFGDLRITFMNVVVDHNIINQYQLETETMDSFELGYLGRFPAANLTLDMRLYRDRIRDYITHTLAPATDLFDNQALAFRNEGDITIDGIDLELTYQPSRHTRIVFSAAFMHASAENFTTDAVYTAQQFEDTVPDYSGSLLAMQRINRNWFASLGYYWADDMLWLRQVPNNNHPTVDAYTRLDLRLARKIDFSDTQGELALVVQNAGSDYQDYRRNTLFSTRTFVTFLLDF